MQSTMVEETCIVQMQPKGDILLEAIFTLTMATVLIGYKV